MLKLLQGLILITGYI